MECIYYKEKPFFYTPRFLPIEIETAAIARAILAQQLLDKACIVGHSLLVAIVTIDEYHQMRGVDAYLGALIVARRCAHSADIIAVNGQPMDVNHATTDALVGFSFTPDAQCEGRSDKLICVKSADGVAESNGRKVD